MYYSDAGSQTNRPLVLVVLVTLFLSVAAEFIPWPGFILPFKPNFPMLALVYWIIHQPKLVNYTAAIIIGIIMDLANQAPMGFNALSGVAVALAANIFGSRFILLTAFAQALHVLVMLAAGQLCLYLLGFFLEDRAAQPALTWFLLTPSYSAAALWLLLPLATRYLRNAVFGRSANVSY